MNENKKSIRRVGKYLVTGMIAKGGMGKIYKAIHPTLNREIILKRLTLVGNRTINERFKREAQLMMDFRHDGIVQVYDHFKEGASYYIAMEYVKGISLAELVEKRRYLPCDIALLLFYEICLSLKYAHDKGVIHRDIKPENILISKSGYVKLTDFGIATSKDCQDEQLTKNMTLGTPAYMSPEQIDDSASVDCRADIYSLGVLLYKMVTGHLPFPGNMTPETINMIAKGKYRMPRKINPRVTPGTEGLIKRSMHHDASHRYTDLAELIPKLEAYLKKFRSSELRREIVRDYIYGNGSFSSRHKTLHQTALISRHTFKKRLIASTALGVLTIASSLLYATSQGYQYLLFQADEYGALQLRAEDKSEEGSLRFIDANIAVKDGKKYRELSGLNLKFNSKGHTRFSTKRIWLHTGEYRITLNANNTLFTRDVFIEPVVSQKYESGKRVGQVEQFDFESSSANAVKLSYSCVDGSTGSDITKATNVHVYRGGWILLKESNTPIVSGKEYTFMFTSPGYKAGYVTAKTQKDQTELRVSTKLYAPTGELVIEKSSDVNISINNRKYIVSGSNEKTSVKLGTSNKQKLELAPGSYFLTASSGSMKQIQEIVITPHSKQLVLVDFDTEGKALICKLK